MLRKTLIAAALLAASTGALAGHNDQAYGRVVTVEPHFVFSIGGGRHNDGFRILYETGGHRYWTHSHHHPGNMILLPRPVGYGVGYYAPPGHWREKHHHRHHDRRDDRWDNRRDHHGDHRRDDRHDGRRDDRHDNRW